MENQIGRRTKLLNQSRVVLGGIGPDREPPIPECIVTLAGLDAMNSGPRLYQCTAQQGQ